MTLNLSTRSSDDSNSTHRDWVPDDALEWFTFIDFIVLFTLISLFGIFMNTFNVVIFSKLGLSDTVNIALLGLSVSDLCFLLLTLMLSICYYPFWKKLDLNFRITDLKLLTLGWPQFYFRRVSNWITAFITFERCLCVALPLRVKQIITPKRALLIIVGIFIMMAMTVTPPYLSSSYIQYWNTHLNRTFIILVFHDNRAEMDAISTGLSFVLTISTFVSVVICTFILVVSLRNKSNWRASTVRMVSSDPFSTRDKRLVKMVTFLSVVFIVSFTPDVCILLAMTFEPRLNFYGQFNNLFFVLTGISETLLAINASCNIFVYVKMSSRFKEIVLRWISSPLKRFISQDINKT